MPTIMVVDDDPDFVEIARLILEQKYEVISAASGRQALERMREDKPDLVLLDVMMSYVLDGIDVAEKMSLDPELQDIPVIVCSSLPISRWPTVTKEPCANNQVAVADWVSKPMRPAELLDKIAKLLERTKDQSRTVQQDDTELVRLRIA